MINIGNIDLDIDFEYRIIREDENDMDLFIDINYRSLDIDCNDSNFFSSRVQFPFVRSLIIRLSKTNKTITVHLMRDIDLFSAFANFEVDCEDSIFSIKNQNEKVLVFKAKK